MIIHQLKQKAYELFPRLMLGRRIAKFMKNSLSLPYVRGGVNWADHIENNMRYFLSDDQLKDESYLKQIKHDIIECIVLYGLDANDYFILGVSEKNREERENILSRIEKDKLCAKFIEERGLDCVQILDQLSNKFTFYQLNKDYFKREACLISSTKDKSSFYDFCSRHDRFIAKDNHGRAGVGAEVINIRLHNNLDVIFEHLMEDGHDWILEELVEQDSRMSIWNDTSVNTVRVPTFSTKEGIVIAYPFTRLGRKGSIVDNASAGGTYASIDAETGIIITDGYDKNGKKYTEHPDSGQKYMGFQIPEWESLIRTVKEIHSSMPKGHKYVGYDMALSNTGWVLIEGNWGNFSPQQSALKVGLKKEFVRLMKA